MVQLALDMQEEVRLFVRMLAAPGETSLEALHCAVRIQQEIEVLVAGTVQQARQRREPWAAIGRALHMSAESAQKKYSSRRAERKVLAAVARRGTPHLTLDTHAPSPGNQASVEDGKDKRGQLASALSLSQRASGRSVRQLGRLSGVSPSYLSRVMCGEKFPSWDLVRKFLEACGEDPSGLRPLWEEAHSHCY
ncbi:helix-turn-helix transcriptional regulator [Streptomyces sp. NPDC051214]|uniref:helix-turn-helix domain-containing protein n=1 Tax=Streptomyces sp. NPDC051214 TaxID=3155282 RepID=UPI003425F6E2